MKRILSALVVFTLLSFSGWAQPVNGTISGQVVDAVTQQPIPGVAVFMYGSVTRFQSPAGFSFDKTKYQYVTYTSGNGVYNLNYGLPGGMVVDTLIVGVLDCNMNETYQLHTVSSGSPNSTGNFSICTPGACDALISKVDHGSGWPYTEYHAQSLRDSSWVTVPSVHHEWVFSDGYTSSRVNPWDQNNDTIWRLTSAIAPNVVACYRRSTNCTPVCDGTIPTPNLNCQAGFYVDTVNSINFQGQIVVWENSSTDSGATIIGYRWDFGDGSAVVNQQYPIHTYSDTGVYQVCLTITSILGNDTCNSTYCDSIGFDSSGNLIHKSSGPGFTINVMDPASVSVKELAISPDAFKLYPNPSTNGATLSWGASINVEKIEIINISGQRVDTVIPEVSSAVQLKALKAGIYILRIETDGGYSSVKMIVQ